MLDIMVGCEYQPQENEVAVIIRMVVEGQVYLHSEKIIHRDQKAGNIQLNNKGECKLADFGVSAQISNTMAKRKTVIGTPFWMAPEVICGGSYDRSSDIWSLGIVLYELCNGDPPHANEHALRALFIIPNSPPPRLIDDIDNDYIWSDEAKDFMERCCQMNPEERPTALELLNHPFIRDIKNPESILIPLAEKTHELMDLIRSMEATAAEDTATDTVPKITDDGIEANFNGNTTSLDQQITYTDKLVQRTLDIKDTLNEYDTAQKLKTNLVNLGDNESQKTARIHRTLTNTLKRYK